MTGSDANEVSRFRRRFALGPDEIGLRVLARADRPNKGLEANASQALRATRAARFPV